MGAFNFKDWDQIYTSQYERSAEHRLASHILYTFLVDAKKISKEFLLQFYTLNPRKKSNHQQYSEGRTPTIKEFLRDLHGGSCEFYCDVLDYDYLDFVTRIESLLPESLIKK